MPRARCETKPIEVIGKTISNLILVNLIILSAEGKSHNKTSWHFSESSERQLFNGKLRNANKNARENNYLSGRFIIAGLIASAN